MRLVPVVSFPDPLTVPTWLTAIFTGLLAVGAIVTAIFAIMAFRKQSTEVGLLQVEAAEQEKAARREAADRRWHQATLVYMTRKLLPGRGTAPAAVAVEVHNTSAQPVYDVRVHWVDGGRFSQAGAEDQLGTVGPGGDEQVQRVVPAGLTDEQLFPVAYFRDAAGDRWTVLADGHLAAVDASLQRGAPEIATTAVRRSLAPPTEPAVAAPAVQQPYVQRVREALRLIRPGSR